MLMLYAPTCLIPAGRLRSAGAGSRGLALEGRAGRGPLLRYAGGRRGTGDPALAATAGHGHSGAPPEPFKYTECVVVAPGEDQTFNAVTSVTASVRISPPLQPDHRIQVVLDGEVYGAWPARMLTAQLDNIYRGTHTLSVLVLDAGRKPVCTGAAVSFHVRQPSLLSPARPRPQP
jgi:hypothetical protein